MVQQSIEKKCYVSVFKHYAGKDEINSEHKEVYLLSIASAVLCPKHVEPNLGMDELMAFTQKGGIIVLQSRNVAFDCETYGLK